MVRNSASNQYKRVFETKFDFLVLIPLLGYILVWSYMTSLRLLSLNATYFDLGSFMERLWFIPTYSWTPLQFLSVFSDTGIQFFMFPFAYVRSYELILLLQTTAIGLCVIPLYGISKIFIRSHKLSLLLSSTFLIYYPIAGVNFFDAHFQAFFPILFLSGYYFFLRRNYAISLFFFFLSGTVRYPYFIFPALYSLLGIMGIFYNSKLKLKLIKGNYWKEFSFYLVLFTVSLIILFIRYSTAGLLTGIATSNSQTAPNQFFYRVLTVILLFFPLLFLPLLSKKWLLFYAPMLFLIFEGPSIYYYPSLFTDQYSLFIYTFIYLGLIDVLSKFSKSQESEYTAKGSKENKEKHYKGSRRNLAIVIIAIFAILILMGAAFEPYGPLNQGSRVDFGLTSYSMNPSASKSLQNALSLIPANDPYVLTQNNLINVYPRPLVPQNNITGLPLIAGMLDVGLNLTLSEIVNDSIPFSSIYGLLYIKIDYILADLNSTWYYFDSYGYPSMAHLLSLFYQSGKYGVMVKQNGIILLKRDYRSPIQLYSPPQFNFIANEFYVNQSAKRFSDHIFVSSTTMPRVDGLASWYGQYISPPPGGCVASLELSITNATESDSIELQVTKWPINLAYVKITVPNFTYSDMQHFNLAFTLLTFSNRLEYRDIDVLWKTSLYSHDVIVEQESLLT